MFFICQIIVYGNSNNKVYERYIKVRYTHSDPLHVAGNHVAVYREVNTKAEYVID